GEDGERGAVVAEIAPDGTVSRTRHRVAESQVLDVTLDVTGATSSSHVRELAQAALSQVQGIVRLTLSGELGPEVSLDLAALQGVGEHLEALVARVGVLRVGYDIEALAAEQTVRGQFVRDVQAAELDDELRRRVLVTGLRALDGRTDE